MLTRMSITVISATDAFTDSLILSEISPAPHYNSFWSEVSGIANGSVATLQQSVDDGENWTDISTFSADGKVLTDIQEDTIYRLGIKADDYADGDEVICQLSIR